MYNVRQKYKTKKHKKNASEKIYMETKMDNIIKFIENNKKKVIIDKLFMMIKDEKYCPEIIGEGHFGKVYIPDGKTIKYKLNDKLLNMSVVIKEAKNNTNVDTCTSMEIINNKLYIYGYGSITTEAIILMYIRKIYDDTIHLPLILAYSTCTENPHIVTRIITRRYGLKNTLEIDLSDKLYVDKPLWIKPRKPITKTFKSKISTLDELHSYIYYNNNDGVVTLPNGIKCNIASLYDYICISYLATHHKLIKHNIYINDMHCSNIFIYWLDEDSYYNDANIKDINEIIYQVKKKYYKIEVFGFAIVLGDLGTSIINVKKDVSIIGQIWDIRTNYKLTVDTDKFTKTCLWNFMIRFILGISTKEYSKTILCRIINSDPYNSYPMILRSLKDYDINFLDNTKLPVELLEDFFYEKYGVVDYEKTTNNIFISSK